MDARGAPAIERHLFDEAADLDVDTRPTRTALLVGERHPMAAESLPVPLRHGVRLNDDQVARPPWPRGAQCHPEGTIGVIEWRPRPLPLECGNLLPERQVLGDQIAPGKAHGPDGTDAERDDEEEQADHGSEVCRAVLAISSRISARPSGRDCGVSHCLEERMSNEEGHQPAGPVRP